MQALNINQSAQQMMQQHGKTFALAAKLLTPASRQDAANLYAFARTIDDWVDVENLNNDALQANIHEAYRDANLDQFGMQNMLNKHAISDAALTVFLSAQLADNHSRQLPTQQSLIDYSYGVAGTIGAIMRPILGAPASAEIYAISLGIAMQLTNIARDVVEDAKRQRIYLPATYFKAPIMPQAILQPSPQQTQATFAAITQMLQLADTYYDFATQGYRYIPLRNRFSIVAAGNMYRAIGVKILRRGQHQYWQGRVSIGLLQKIGIALFAIVKTGFEGFFIAKPVPQNSAIIVKSIEFAMTSFAKHK